MSESVCLWAVNIIIFCIPRWRPKVPTRIGRTGSDQELTGSNGLANGDQKTQDHVNVIGSKSVILFFFFFLPTNPTSKDLIRL